MPEQLSLAAMAEPVAIAGGYLEATARLSDCGLYRYTLARVWDRDLAHVTWICLNPSSADAQNDDPTLRKIVGFSRRWGFGCARVLNLFAYRATKPQDLWAARRRRVDVVGPENDEQLAGVSGQVVCAWGLGGAHVPERVVSVLARLASADVVCLGTTSGGHPAHPLYLPWETPRIPFQGGPNGRTE